MAYCPECGTRIQKTAKFCRECGCDLAIDTQQAHLQASSSEQKCAIHRNMNSIGVCDKCGIAVCVICKSDVKDKLYCPNCIDDVMQLQRDLDWLQNFREQYEEVIRLNLEMQDVAKGIPLTSQESETKPPSGVREQLKELQRSFANLEKSLSGWPKPKSSDLRKMSFSLENACKYYGITCVAYRKWAEKPSSSIEVYTNEKLSKAGKYMDKVNEQLTLADWHKRQPAKPPTAEISRNIQSAIPSLSICQECGRHTQTRYMIFCQVISMLIIWQRSSIKGHLCKECARSYFWDYTFFSLLLGWFGPSLLLLPFYILNNIFFYIRTLRMEPQHDSEEFNSS